MLKEPAKTDFFLHIWQRQILTSFGLKVRYAVHDDVMQEQRLVVDFYVSRQKAVEVSHIPAEKREAELSAVLILHVEKWF